MTYFQNLADILTAIGGVVNTAIPILIGLALLGFLWGLAKFVFSAGDENKRSEGKKVMVWGVIALFLAIAVWGIVNFIITAFGFTSLEAPDAPGAPGAAGSGPVL